MAKDNKKLVQAITSQEENFAQWYTDICVKAELVEYSSVKGFIILRPYGQAIWELIQKDMDARFKATGHENVAMPVLIPESLLQKEGELVNGFAPEVAWVTMGGSDKLEERLAVRPTSETMFCDHWSRVLHSYRELPMKYNQWCSVVRWEKTTRPFLRSREFWWQEGHTIMSLSIVILAGSMSSCSASSARIFSNVSMIVVSFCFNFASSRCADHGSPSLLPFGGQTVSLRRTLSFFISHDMLIVKPRFASGMVFRAKIPFKISLPPLFCLTDGGYFLIIIEWQVYGD